MRGGCGARLTAKCSQDRRDPMGASCLQWDSEVVAHPVNLSSCSPFGPIPLQQGDEHIGDMPRSRKNELLAQYRRQRFSEKLSQHNTSIELTYCAESFWGAVYAPACPGFAGFGFVSSGKVA